jgi:IclR family acetate operon transcriptional repressor
MESRARRSGAALAVLDRGLDVLEVLAERGELPLRDLAATLHTSPATMFRTFALLRARGYVERVPGNQYRLGSQIAVLASRAGSASIGRLADPKLLELQATTGETVNLVVLRGPRIIYASIVEGAYGMRMTATVGQEAPSHATAVGKAILAHLPVPHAQQFAGPEPYTAYTAATKRHWLDLEPDLELARERGYAEDNEEVEGFVTCIGAPIIGSDGYPIAAISVSALTPRLPVRARPRVGHAVQEACESISLALRNEAPSGTGSAAADHQGAHGTGP